MLGTSSCKYQIEDKQRILEGKATDRLQWKSPMDCINKILSWTAGVTSLSLDLGEILLKTDLSSVILWRLHAARPYPIYKKDTAAAVLEAARSII
jgi:hypothetical protein